MIMDRCLIAFSCVVLFAFSAGQPLSGQEECVTYKMVPETVYKIRPVNQVRSVKETVMQTEQITAYKPVWTQETRHRKTTVLKPTTKTSERVERYLVRRPVIEKSFEERQIEETVFETTTEMTEKRYLVETPVVETQMREEEVVVRKPVTKTIIQSDEVTTYKPKTVSQTEFVAGANIRNDLFWQSGRNRLRWLRPGNYVDPATGVVAYRGRGLHWAQDQNLVLQPTICLLYTSPSPRDQRGSRMPSSA